MSKSGNSGNKGSGSKGGGSSQPGGNSPSKTGNLSGPRRGNNPPKSKGTRYIGSAVMLVALLLSSRAEANFDIKDFAIGQISKYAEGHIAKQQANICSGAIMQRNPLYPGHLYAGHIEGTEVLIGSPQGSQTVMVGVVNNPNGYRSVHSVVCNYASSRLVGILIDNRPLM